MNTNPIVIADAQGIIRFWSNGAEATFGYSADQSVGQSLDLIVPPEYREAHWNGFRRAVMSGKAVEGQVNPIPVNTVGGEVITIPGQLTLVRDASGQVIAVMVVFG